MTEEQLENYAWSILGDYADVIRLSYEAEDDDPRHLAYTDTSDDQITIVISPRLARFKQDKIDGVLYHELGHILDHLHDYPAIEEEDPERRADAIVKYCYGVRIYYGRRDLIQTLDPKEGVWPRPEGLT